MKKIIHSPKAPKAIGPYSQAVEVNGMLYISGQLPVDVATGKFVEGGIKEQTEQVFRICTSASSGTFAEAGYSFEHVVKSTCLLSDMADFAAMNEVYATYYTKSFPARAAFAVKSLPMGALIEIETIAIK